MLRFRSVGRSRSGRVSLEGNADAMLFQVVRISGSIGKRIFFLGCVMEVGRCIYGSLAWSYRGSRTNGDMGRPINSSNSLSDACQNTFCIRHTIATMGAKGIMCNHYRCRCGRAYRPLPALYTADLLTEYFRMGQAPLVTISWSLLMLLGARPPGSTIELQLGSSWFEAATVSSISISLLLYNLDLLKVERARERNPLLLLKPCSETTLCLTSVTLSHWTIPGTAVQPFFLKVANSTASFLAHTRTRFCKTTASH
jgi:hypothetical protein